MPKRPLLQPGKSREKVYQNALKLRAAGFSRKDAVRHAMEFAGLRKPSDALEKTKSSIH